MATTTMDVISTRGLLMLSPRPKLKLTQMPLTTLDHPLDIPNNYYGRHFYKRSADAEPEAEAEADADAAYYFRSSFGHPQQYYGFNNFHGNFRNFYGNYRNF